MAADAGKMPRFRRGDVPARRSRLPAICCLPAIDVAAELVSAG